MVNYNNNNFSKGTDFAVILLYVIMVVIGIVCIFMVEYNPNLNWSNSFLTAKTNYSKQIYFAVFCVFVAIFILLIDSKIFTALANIFYAGGILLMLATFFWGKILMDLKVGYLLRVDLIYSPLNFVKYLQP